MRSPDKRVGSILPGVPTPDTPTRSRTPTVTSNLTREGQPRNFRSLPSHFPSTSTVRSLGTPSWSTDRRSLETSDTVDPQLMKLMTGLDPAQRDLDV